MLSPGDRSCSHFLRLESPEGCCDSQSCVSRSPAYALSTLGDRDGAVKEATTAARLNRGNERYFLNLAELYFEFKNYEQAKAVFEQLTASEDPKIASLASQRLGTLKTFDGARQSAAPKPRF